jgi:hypothetical protein
VFPAARVVPPLPEERRLSLTRIKASAGTSG